MTYQAVRVQEKGQVTIPSEIRQKLGLKKGDLVVFIETEHGYIIKPAALVTTKAPKMVGQVHREMLVTFQDLVEWGKKRSPLF
jgi:AbrB family looped-hinge helix DNA binding protein